MAIKPFQSIGSDPEEERFAFGLTYGIVAALNRVPGLTRVNDETPSYVKSKQMTVENWGGVSMFRYVLRGSVRKDGDRIRVNPELIEVPTELRLRS